MKAKKIQLHVVLWFGSSCFIDLCVYQFSKAFLSRIDKNLIWSFKKGVLSYTHRFDLHSRLNTVRFIGSHCFRFHVSSLFLVAIGLIVQHIKDILNGNKSSETDGVHDPGRRQRHHSDSSMISSRPH